MNVPTIQPPKRKRDIGPAPKLTPMQEVDLWSWYCAKRHLGSQKSQAKKMGIPLNRFIGALHNMKRRERNQVER